MAKTRKYRASAEDRKLLEFARECFDDSKEYWDPIYEEFDECARFRALDQWPDQIKAARQDATDPRPCLVFDQINQYIRQTVNDGRRNRPSIKTKPVNSKASEAGAQILDGLVRNIEYQSRAHVAYDTALDAAAQHGLGFMRLVPKTIDVERNIQELRIVRLPFYRAVYTDPSWIEPDGSDMAYAFVLQRYRKKLFERRWPGIDVSGWDSSYPEWATETEIVVAEFLWVYEEEEENDKPEPGVVVKGGEDENALLDDTDESYDEGPITRPEDFKRRKCVAWDTICAGAVLHRTIFKSQYVPVVPIIGTEYFVEDRRVLQGMVQPARDGQMAYNYALNADIEYISLAPKAPYIGAAGQFKGHENEWKSANIKNIPYLEYEPKSYPDGSSIPAPQRAQPPVISGWQQMAQVARADIQSGLGMYNSSVGAPSNERSGKAIMARNAEADTSVFHYTANQQLSIAHLGRIVIETIPTYYDTQGIRRIVGEDGQAEMVGINPEMDKAYERNPATGMQIFNPSFGAYDVAIESGPSYTTKREEAVAALVEMTRGNAQLFSVVGDLVFQAMDWPYADRIAKRLRTLLTPPIQQLENSPNDPESLKQQLMQAAQQNQQLNQAMQQIVPKLQELQAQLTNKSRELDIKQDEANTARIKVMGTALSAEQVQTVVASTMQDFLMSTGLLAPSMPQQPMQQPGMQQPGMMPQGETQLPGQSADSVFPQG